LDLGDADAYEHDIRRELVEEVGGISVMIPTIVQHPAVRGVLWQERDVVGFDTVVDAKVYVAHWLLI